MSGKSPEQLAKERLARLEAANNLEEPDRVPVVGFGGDIVAAYAGITQYEFCYDYEKTRMAIAKFNRDFPFDVSFATGFAGVGLPTLPYAFVDHPELLGAVGMGGRVHDILQDKCSRYPGRELDENSSPQFIGGTFMEADEYDQLIEDPVGFIAETVLPRQCRNLETPRKAMATWVRLGLESLNGLVYMQGFAEELAKLGYAFTPGTIALAPLDLIGDALRDINNVLLDIHRCPDKVKKACEALIEPIVKLALSSKDFGVKSAAMPLHLNEYLSPKLYKEFYWPYLKEIILRFLDEGIKTHLFFGGQHEQHLETILELPKGWGSAGFEKTDVVKAKEILQGHTCIQGGIPVSLIATGTPQEIDEYIKNLLEKVKPGGGFVLAPNVATAPAFTPPENIHALIEAVEKYGKY